MLRIFVSAKRSMYRMLRRLVNIRRDIFGPEYSIYNEEYIECSD